MRSVQSDELRKTLRSVLDAVKSGERYEVLRYQRVEAVIVPADWYEQAIKALGEGGAR